MGWLDLAGANVSDTNKTTNTQTNASGTQTPVVSPQFNTAYGNLSGGVNAQGQTPGQAAAISFATGQMNPATNPVNQQMATTNTGLDNANQTLGYLNQSVLGPMVGAAPRQSAAPGTIASATTASGTAPYSDLYSQQLIDPSLKAMDYGTDRAFSALDARTAGAGGFANSRAGLGYSDLGTQSALQRGQLEAQLKTTGLTNALGYAQGDVTRQQQADTQNVGNLMANNQFNVNAGYAGDQQKMAIVQQMSGLLSQQAGLTQQQLQNVITANGINMDAATALFTSGQITQDQLNKIIAAAQQYNGTTFQGNTGSSTNSNEIAGSAHFGI